MARPNINPYTNDYLFGSGVFMFNPLVLGVYQGLRPFGNTTGFTVTIEAEKLEHVNYETAARETDASLAISTVRTFELVSDNFSSDNLALFMSGDSVTLTQAATPVVAEVVGPVNNNRTYNLGVTTNNPTGVRNIGSVVVRVAEGDIAAARINSNPYVAGNIYRPAVANLHWYLCTIAGTSNATPPTFTTDGTTFADGTATFRDMGLIIVPSTSNINYRLDTTQALLSITPAGTIAAANTIYASVVSGGLLSLNVDYTPVAGTRNQIRTGSGAEQEGVLIFIADNQKGTNRRMEIKSCLLTPSGDLPFISEGDFATMTFSAAAQKIDSVTEAIYIDGPFAAS